MNKMALFLALAMACNGAVGASGEQAAPVEPKAATDDAGPKPSLADLASKAELIALVQVADTDYVYAREFPTGGRAYLRVLIPYKVTEPIGDMIEVYEEGLHPHECYFKDPTVYEEGRRFLVFLRRNPQKAGQYLGLPEGCALQVLVTKDNLYALRYPLSGIDLSDDLSEFAERLVFADRYAAFDDDGMTVAERNRLLEGGFLERTDSGYRYTHGVDLSTVRRLIGEDAMSPDQSLLQPGKQPADP